MGMEFRPYYFAREWTRMGHHVRIIGASYSHLRMKNPTVKQDFQKEMIDGIAYHWVKTGQYEGNGIKRALTMFRFVGKIWLAARQIAEKWKPDVVITSSTYPLDTYAGQRIVKFSGARLIHEVHDMWPITPMELNGMPRYHPFIIMLQIAENSFCKNSDYVVSLLPHAKEYFKQHGMTGDKFRFIPNGVVLEEWENKEALPEKAKQVLEQMRKEHKAVLCFFGSHTDSYALEYLIEAVKEFDYREIGLVLVGDGNCKDRLKEQSKDCKNIYFLDAIPKKSIPSLLESIDCIYIGAVNNRMFRFGICMNKLFDSMMGGKPILYAVNAPNNYIRKFRCGISVQAENAESLRKGIQTFLDKTEIERIQMGDNGKHAALKYFNYTILASKFEKLFGR